MSHRFSYVRYDEEATLKQAAFKEKFEELERMAHGALPNSREKSLFLTALEEAYMWTGKAIRDDQIARQGKVDEQPERNDE